MGRWDPILAAPRDPGLDVMFIDTATVHAHPCAAGVKLMGLLRRPGRSGPRPRRLGTKFHASVGGLGHPVELILTGAQESDIGQAEAPLADHEPGSGIADRGDDKESLVEGRGAEAVIPTQEGRKEQREIDRYLYRERDMAERCRSKVKPYCRMATRHEKKAANYLTFVKVAMMMVMLE